jgi:nitroreductase
MSEPNDDALWESSPLRFDSDRPIEADVLVRILRRATLAPSPFNLQPWRFLVVRERANRRRLQTRAWNEPRLGQAPVVVIVLGHHEPDRSHLDAILAQMLERGACAKEQAAEVRGRAKASLAHVTDRALWATRTTMAAAAHLMQAAKSEGVAAALIDQFETEGVRVDFGVPEDHAICCLIALGHVAERAPFAGRLGLDEVCFAEHFGQPWAG